MSDKFLTIGVRATKDVRKAFDMLLDKTGSKSYKSLFERLLCGYVNSQIKFFNSVIVAENKDIEKASNSLAECNELLQAETDDRIKAILVSQITSLEATIKHHIEGRESATVNRDFYVQVSSTAFPSKNYPSDIDDDDVMFRD